MLSVLPIRRSPLLSVCRMVMIHCAGTVVLWWGRGGRYYKHHLESYVSYVSSLEVQHLSDQYLYRYFHVLLSTGKVSG